MNNFKNKLPFTVNIRRQTKGIWARENQCTVGCLFTGVFGQNFDLGKVKKLLIVFCLHGWRFTDQEEFTSFHLSFVRKSEENLVSGLKLFRRKVQEQTWAKISLWGYSGNSREGYHDGHCSSSGPLVILGARCKVQAPFNSKMCWEDVFWSRSKNRRIQAEINGIIFLF